MGTVGGDNYNLEGKAAIVTGGSRGIGAAIAVRLAQSGADVAVVHRGSATPQETERSIRELGRRSLVLNGIDVSDASAVRSAVGTTLAEFGRLDILVNNAGIYKHSLPEETTDAEWDEVLGVNLRGAFLFSREVGRAMIKAGKGGRIVNMASIDAFQPESDFAHYDSSKAGILGLTRSLALSWGKHGINVNAVAPGLVKTEGMLDVARNRAEAFKKAAPLRRIPSPEDVAAAVAFLCSESSSGITGQTIVVDSGVSLSGYMSLTGGG